MTIRAISYGGGVQSTALVVLGATGRLVVRREPGSDPEPWPVDVAIFSNVGSDSELPETIEYVRDVVAPWAADRGLDVVETGRTTRTGEPGRTLLEELDRPDSRSIGIPVRMSNGAPGRRSCTETYKIRPVDKWLRQHGAGPDDLAENRYRILDRRALPGQYEENEQGLPAGLSASRPRPRPGLLSRDHRRRRAPGPS